MKNISKLFLALFTLVIASCSVEDVEDRPIIEAKDAPVLTAPDAGSKYVLTPATADKLFDRFAWTPANFNGPVVITYQIEIAELDDVNFEHPQLVQSSQTNNVAVTGDNLNKAAILLGLTPFVESNVLVRVKAISGETAVTNASESIIISLTPFKTAPLLGIVGDHQTPDWNLPALQNHYYQMEPSAKGNPDFEAYIYLNGGFKLLEASDDLTFSWDNVAYGKGEDAESIATGEGVANLTAAAGYYRVRANTQTLTYSAVKMQWGIIGAATPAGWDSDTDLTYDPVTRVLTAEMVMVPGDFKFRPNDNWDGELNFDSVHGEFAKGDGSNIAFTGAAGTYKVTLDLSHSRAYTYKFEKL